MGELLGEYIESLSTDVTSLSRRLSWSVSDTERVLSSGFGEFPPRTTLEHLATVLLTDYEVVLAAALRDLGYITRRTRLSGLVPCLGVEYYPHDGSAPIRTACVSRRLASSHAVTVLRQHGVDSEIALDVLHEALLAPGQPGLTPTGGALAIRALSPHLADDYRGSDNHG